VTADVLVIGSGQRPWAIAKCALRPRPARRWPLGGRPPFPWGNTVTGSVAPELDARGFRHLRGATAWLRTASGYFSDRLAR